MEENFESLGFERDTDREDKPIVGEKGQPIYMKGFVKQYGEIIRFYQILGSRDPNNLEYELHIDPPEHMEKREIQQHLEEMLNEFKKQKRIPANVELKIKAKYEFPEGPKIKGKDLNKIYDDFEQALIGLGYIDQSIKDKKSVVIKGWQVGLG